MEIYNEAGQAPAMAAMFRAMPDAQLLAQDLVQQGAIHAVSFLLQHGCSEQTAIEMLASLRESAGLVREEARRRGRTHFEADQVVFS